MINEELMKNAAERLSSPLTNVDAMSVSELLSLRAQIDARLPARELKDLDLEHELIVQFQTVKTLQMDIMDSNAMGNQKAQVANTVASTLNQLVMMQEKYHNGERLKQIETKLIKALNKLPQDQLKEFFDWYEGELNAA